MISEKERAICCQVLKDILNPISDVERDAYVEKILNITYSIGGDYSEKTFRKIAEVLLE